MDQQSAWEVVTEALGEGVQLLVLLIIVIIAALVLLPLTVRQKRAHYGSIM